MAQHEQQFDAFISYRRSDGERIARRLRRRLQSYDISRRLKAPGRRRRLTVFLDTIYERGTVDFYDKNILPALTASRFLVVVATPDAVRRAEGTDDWIGREISDFRHHCDPEHILVVRAAGDLLSELPGDLSVTAPNVQIIDLRQDGLWSVLSPLRASRLADEWLKLVAPLFDVTPEEMPRLRREQEKIQQARVSVALGAVAGAVIFATGVAALAVSATLKSDATVAESLFTIGQLIRGTNSLSADEDLDSNRQELLMMECDLFDALAGGMTPRGFELEHVMCGTDRANALYQAGEPEAAGRLLAQLLQGSEARFEADPKPDTARALKMTLDLDWAFVLATGANDDADDPAPALTVNLDRMAAALQSLPTDTNLYKGVKERLWDLIERAEEAGRFAESRRLMKRGLQAFTRTAEAGNDDPAVDPDARRAVLIDRAILQRRLAWLDVEHLDQPVRAEAAAAEALALLDAGHAGAQTPEGEMSSKMIWERVLAEEVMGLAKQKSDQADEARAAFERALTSLELLRTRDLNDKAREQADRESQFLRGRLAALEATR